MAEVAVAQPVVEQAAPGAAAAPAVQPYASASLYVGDLAPDVTESNLFELFNNVGPVASVRVCRDAATRRSLGYAYVNFHRVEDAETALETMNFTPIRGVVCRIMWSQRDPSLRKSGAGNIFVKHLDKSIDNKTLYDTFSIFGNILSCKVAVNNKRESLGYGFVHFERDDSARLAISKVDGMVIAGQKVSVAPFKPKNDRGVDDKGKFTNLYVKNLPTTISKEQMDEMFSAFGPITSSMLAVSNGESKGFGFVNYAQPEHAQAAVDAMNNKEMDGKTLYVSRAQKREERERELRQRFEAMKAERMKKYPAGVNLYVKNLSDEVDDAQLSEMFSPYGHITSAKVMKHSGTTRSRGFGFVCFSNPEEATKAVSEMNAKMIGSKPLYVSLAQRKDIRRAQLEAQHAQRAKMVMPQQAMYMAAPGMYYPNAPMPQRMMYPPQQMAMRSAWNNRRVMAGGPQQPQMGMAPMVNYTPMQVNGAPNPRQGQQGPRRGRGQQNNRTPTNMNGQPRAGPSKHQQPEVAAPVVQAPFPQSATLTIQELAAAPEQAQKQMIGERLFPLIHAREPVRAGKITGMLLEMDNGELLHLLESADALSQKVNEALAVLRQHEVEDAQM